MYTEVLVQGTGKLVQRRRHLEALLEDTALALDAHDLGPLDEPVQVLLGRKRTADTELLRPLLEERVGNLLLHGPNVTKSVSQSNHGTLHISRKNVVGRSTYCFLLGGYRRLATSLRGLQI